MMEFSDKKSGELVRVGIDFVRLLAALETISTAGVTVSVLRGTDPLPASILNGAASIRVWLLQLFLVATERLREL